MATFGRFLDDVGDGSGDMEGAQNHTGGVEFFAQPAAGVTWRVTKIVVYVTDEKGGVSNELGKITAVTTGMQFRKYDGSSATNLNTTVVKQNSHFADDFQEVTSARYNDSADEETIIATMYPGMTGNMLTYAGTSNERISVTLDDNYSGLLQLRIWAEGYEI